MMTSQPTPRARKRQWMRWEATDRKIAEMKRKRKTVEERGSLEKLVTGARVEMTLS